MGWIAWPVSVSRADRPALFEAVVAASGAAMTDKRVAIVTGGFRGIGAAIVRRLGKAGLHVVAVARTLEKLQEVCNAVNGEGGSGGPLACDIADPKALAAAVDKVAE